MISYYSFDYRKDVPGLRVGDFLTYEKMLRYWPGLLSGCRRGRYLYLRMCVATRRGYSDFLLGEAMGRWDAHTDRCEECPRDQHRV